MNRACFVCLEPHWENRRLTGPAIDPMAPCIHRESELVELERSRNFEIAHFRKLTEMPEQTRQLVIPADSGIQRSSLPIFQPDLRGEMPDRKPMGAAA